MIIKNHIRSISLPSRSHPTTLAIEESLDKLHITMNTTTMTSSDPVYSGLVGLEELYERTEDFLKMGSTQSVLSFHNEKKNIKREFMEDMLDGSLKLMDTCNVTRDLMVETQEQVLGLRSCVRRRKNKKGIDFSSYVEFRKNMKKQVKKLLGFLKNISIGLVIKDHDCCDVHFLAVVYTMTRVVSMTVCVLKSFLEFLSGRQQGKDIKSKLALVLMNKKFHNDVIENMFESVDTAISRDSCSNYEDLNKKLEELEVWIRMFEKSLEGLFRGLIRTRASLLNIISQ
ncbi:unnamed protein product [Cochlearia groenlandica]